MTSPRTLTIRIVTASVLLVTVLTVLAACAPTATAQNPVPFIDQPLAPDAVAPGGTGFTLTVNGAGFVPSSAVNWNGSPRATTFVSNSKLTATILASDIAKTSTAPVTVVNPSPGGGASNIQLFSIAMAGTSASFQPVELYDGIQYIIYTAVAIADINGDGKPDLVVASQNWSTPNMGVSTGDGAIEIFLGNGDGTFQSPVSYDSGGGNPSALAIADLNGDGKLDVIVLNQGNDGGAFGVGVLLGNGDGTFQGVRFTTAFGGTGVVAADVNGDGKIDVIVSSCCQGGISGGEAEVLLGNGDGTFQTAAYYPSGTGGEGGIAVGDVNGDGKLDLVMTGSCPEAGSCAGSPYPDGVVGVMLGNGDGTFQAPVVYDSLGYDADSVTVADVNGDGKPDLLVGNCQLSGYGCGQATVGVLLGNGNGTFQPTVIYTAGGNEGNVSWVTTADVNMDGKLDVVAAPWFGGSSVVLLGNGNGTFQPAVSFGSGASYPISLAVADVNGDGKPDVVAVNWCTAGDGIGCVAYDESSMGVLLNDIGAVQSSTDTTVSSSVNPSAYGQPVTLTAAVSSASGTPTGTVIFYDGSTTLGSATLASRSASISVSSLTIASHSITAVYQGCSTFAASTSAPLNQVVSQAPTTTALASSANPEGIDKNFILTATVTGEFGATATGSVVFYSGSQTLGTSTLSGNRATLTTSFDTAGTYSLSAVYKGDVNNLGSTSQVFSQVITAATTTTLTSLLNPSFYGQSVTFTATVTSSGGTPPNGEIVTFEEGSTVLGTATLSGGSAIFSYSTLGVGTRIVKAVYSGDPSFTTSTSKSLDQVVNKATTTTTLASSQNPSAFNQSVTFTSTVTPQFSGTPTGNMTFKNGTVTLKGGVALSGGVATYTTTKLAVGTGSITAEYAGSTSFLSSTSPAVDQVVSPATTTTTLTSSLNPSNYGQSVTFTATLTAQFGGTVTGSVNFMDGTTLLKTVNLGAGKATYKTSTLATGTHNITAAYNGSTDYSTSSASLTQTVQ